MTQLLMKYSQAKCRPLILGDSKSSKRSCNKNNIYRIQLTRQLTSKQFSGVPQFLLNTIQQQQNLDKKKNPVFVKEPIQMTVSARGVALRQYLIQVSSLPYYRLHEPVLRLLPKPSLLIIRKLSSSRSTLNLRYKILFQ